MRIDTDTAAADCFKISRLADLNALADRAAAANLPMLPLFRAAADGELALIRFELADGAWPRRTIEAATRPVVILIGDDPFPVREAVGPTGWACARRLRYWRPQAVIAHGSGPHADHYRAAVDAARLVRRVVLVETTSDFIDTWAAFLDCPATLRILPPEGRMHPDRSRPAVLQ